MRILEEFWYGNIEPTEYDTSSCKEYKKLLELICRNEEKLQKLFVRHGIGTPEVPNCSTMPLVLLAGAVRSRTRL